MKKALSLILAFVLCFGLCACGENSESGESNESNVAIPSKDEMLASAEIFDRSAFDDACYADFAKAEEAYVGKTYKLTGVVKQINKDSCILYNNIIVSLDTDAIQQLTVDKSICIVGIVSEIRYKQTTQQTESGTTTIHDNYLIMDQAYYLGDVSDPAGEA